MVVVWGCVRNGSRVGCHFRLVDILMWGVLGGVYDVPRFLCVKLGVCL